MELSLRARSVVVAGALALLLVAAAGVATQARAASSSAQEECRRRVECFELRALPDGPAIGFASLHKSDSAGGTQLEWQVSFPADEFNIWHVESSDAQSQRWIWREREPRNSRSVIVDHAAAGLEVTEWGRPTVWRTVLPAPATCVFPLELEELLRARALDSTTVALFDPLANEVESVRVETAAPDATEIEGLRRVDLVRADGSLAGSWTFLGAELVSFRWQRGGLIAVRIDEERYAKGRQLAQIATSAAVQPAELPRMTVPKNR